jgi:hypothetical protein
MVGLLGYFVCLTDEKTTDSRFIDIFRKYLCLLDVVLFVMKGGETWFVAFYERPGSQMYASE